jgi:hypothetical protein
MDTSMKGIGKTTKQSVMVPKRVKTDLNMLDSFTLTSSMARELKSGQTAPAILATTSRAKSMGEAASHGWTEALTKVNSFRITLRARVSIDGQMAESMWVNGSTIRCMDLVPSLGLMDVVTWATTSLTRKKALVPSNGLISESMKGSGSMASSMVWAPTPWDLT